MTTSSDPGRASLDESSSGSERANRLAAEFERANADGIATVERLSDADWRKTTVEGWTVATCAHHVASVHADIARFLQRFAEGRHRPHPPGMEAIDASNAEHAREHADCSKADVLAELRTQGAAAAAIVRGFSDEQLDRSAVVVEGNPALTTSQLVERALLGHLRVHLGSIKQAVDPH